MHVQPDRGKERSRLRYFQHSTLGTHDRMGGALDTFGQRHHRAKRSDLLAHNGRCAPSALSPYHEFEAVYLSSRVRPEFELDRLPVVSYPERRRRIKRVRKDKVTGAEHDRPGKQINMNLVPESGSCASNVLGIPIGEKLERGFR